MAKIVLKPLRFVDCNDNGCVARGFPGFYCEITREKKRVRVSLWINDKHTKREYAHSFCGAKEIANTWHRNYCGAFVDMLDVAEEEQSR